MYDDIEIMAPAGSHESLAAALAAGADSVYFGVGDLNMRARSTSNFRQDELGDITFAIQKKGARAYLAVNTVLYDDELDRMRSLINSAAEAGVDAVIVSDQAAMLYAREKGLEVHISTQLNISNIESLRFYSRWADVVVLARELSLEQVARIHGTIERENICGPSGRQVKIEMFAHGALCMALSGKCYLSLHESGCSANRGACRQICRRSFTLTDRDTGEQIAAEGKYLLSPKDLCTVGFLDKFIGAGVRVLKIEGRARSAEYVKRVVECYREAIEALREGRYSPELATGLTRRLSEVFNRGFWDGFYSGATVPELSGHYGSAATRKKVYVGKVTNYYKNIGVAEILIEAAVLDEGDEIVFIGATTGALESRAGGIRVDEKPAKFAPQGRYCSFRTPSEVKRGDKLYKIVEA
ncbi:MAG: U32 family peptidase [Rikenellaceae bacterium]|nr:U32 family peptidase [Rikenellaceae bacterium]